MVILSKALWQYWKILAEDHHSIMPHGFKVRTLADLNLKPTKEMFSTEERDLDEMVEIFTVGKVLGRFEGEKNHGGGSTCDDDFYGLHFDLPSNDVLEHGQILVVLYNVSQRNLRKWTAGKFDLSVWPYISVWGNERGNFTPKCNIFAHKLIFFRIFIGEHAPLKSLVFSYVFRFPSFGYIFEGAASLQAYKPVRSPAGHRFARNTNSKGSPPSQHYLLSAGIRHCFLCTQPSHCIRAPSIPLFRQPTGDHLQNSQSRKEGCSNIGGFSK